MGHVKDLIFSIYPDPAKEGQTSPYSTQVVHKAGYYPPEIEYLIEKIEESESPLEIEQAVDNFTGFISNRKSSIIELYRLSLVRENINQRSIYLLLNNTNNDPLMNYDKSEIIYIGGSLGGGSLNLDHELKELKSTKWAHLIKFDGDNVGIEIDEIEIDKTFSITEKIILKNSADHKYSVDRLPISIQDFDYVLVRAADYFEKLYQDVSLINDFAPLVDSGVVAAEAVLNANLLYFNPFPDVLKQRLEQYNLSSDLPDFLGIQKLVTDLSNQDKIKISGYSFEEKEKSYSMVIGDLFLGLKSFLISEAPLEASVRIINSLKTNSDLIWQIEEYIKNFQQLGKRGQINRFEGRRSEILRNMIGLKALNQRLYNIDKLYTEIPYAKIIWEEGTGILTTSLSNNELLDEYIPAFQNFIEPLVLLATGPLEIFKFKVTKISVHLEIGNYKFLISRSQDKENPKKINIILSYLVQNDSELLQIFSKRNLPIPDWINGSLEQIQINANNHLSKIESNQIDRKIDMSKEDIRSIIAERRSVTPFARNILSKHVVPVLLRRIIKEISDWEENYDITGTIDRIKNSYLQKENYYEDELSEVNNRYRRFGGDKELEVEAIISEQLKKTELDHASDEKLSTLENRMNQFNKDIYSFIVDSLRRDQNTLVSDSRELYTYLKNLYEDIRVAIIDFGLVPSVWAKADNIQLLNAYKAQINYIKHSLIVMIRKFLGDDYEGNDLNLLVNYKFANNMTYNSFDGNLTGSDYLNLKKAYLYFFPKFEKYQSEITYITNIPDLLSALEKLEKNKRSQLMSALPKLPEMKGN